MRDSLSRFWYGWMADADRVYGANAKRLLSEDEDGRILMPSKTRQNCWGPTEFNPCNPLHWSAWWRSRRSMTLVWVEAVPDA